MNTPKYTPITTGTNTKQLAPGANAEEALAVPTINFGKAGLEVVTHNLPVPPIYTDEEALPAPMLNFAKARPAKAQAAPSGVEQALGVPAMAF
jgi:hypothetical protein